MSAAIEQFKPETLIILERQAKTFGLSLDDYVRSLLPKTEKELPLAKHFKADMIVFAEGTENLSTYNGIFSREDIYFDHD